MNEHFIIDSGSCEMSGHLHSFMCKQPFYDVTCQGGAIVKLVYVLLGTLTYSRIKLHICFGIDKATLKAVKYGVQYLLHVV